MGNGSRGIQSIEVSGRILRALARSREPMMLKEIAQEAGLAPAQCHAYLTSLRHVDLVRQDPTTGLYGTGAFALRLATSWLKSVPLVSAAIRELNTLTNELGFFSLIAVWSSYGATIVHMNSGVTQTALNLRPGTVYSVTGTATGRIFAAFGMTPEVEERIAEELSRSGQADWIGSVVGRDEFEVKLRKTRESGFAIAEGAPVPSINAVSAPVFGPNGELSFAATLVGPHGELLVDDDAVAVRRLMATTRNLSSGRF
jgi:DNA-binding IclR family transcriptional regulator